jgi:hypothetical protein
MNIMNIVSAENITMSDMIKPPAPGGIAYGPSWPHAMKIPFALNIPGIARQVSDCDTVYVKHPEIMHEDILSSPRGRTMTNGLLRQGRAAASQLIITFRQPTGLNMPAPLQAWMITRKPQVFRLPAAIMQDGVAKAEARASLMLPKWKDLAILDIPQ